MVSTWSDCSVQCTASFQMGERHLLPRLHHKEILKFIWPQIFSSNLLNCVSQNFVWLQVKVFEDCRSISEIVNKTKTAESVRKSGYHPPSPLQNLFSHSEVWGVAPHPRLAKGNEKITKKSLFLGKFLKMGLGGYIFPHSRIFVGTFTDKFGKKVFNTFPINYQSD